jgi:lysophospholipase L1-like esterase
MDCEKQSSTGDGLERAVPFSLSAIDVITLLRGPTSEVNMIVRSSAAWVFGICLSLSSICAVAQAPPTQPTTRMAMGPIPIDQPAVKLGRDGQPDKHFLQLHESFLARGKEGKIGVLFLGDSITEGWNKARNVWQAHYGNLDVANFGIGGDRTEHVLWRIDNGELDGISPKVVVLLIGTNNIGNSANDIAAADTKIIEKIHEKLPDTKVLVLGIFPRGADPENPATAQMRDRIKLVNEKLAKLDDGNKTRFLDISDKFLNPDGVIRFSMMPDALHPTAKGYKLWAEAMQPLLDEMLK